jgi:hypothetical protein
VESSIDADVLMGEEAAARCFNRVDRPIVV